MPHVILPTSWRIPEREVTPEAVYWDRRRFLRALGWAGASALAASAGCRPARTDGPPFVPAELAPDHPPEITALYPASRNDAYRVTRAITDEAAAATYNNFYEFSADKRGPSARRLMALACATIRQDGDDGATISFHVDDVAQVAKILKPRTRRQLSEEQKARLREMGASYRFSSGTDERGAAQKSPIAPQDGSEHLSGEAAVLGV